MPNDPRAGDLDFILYTNRALAAERALEVVSELVRFIKLETGPDAFVEIVQMGQGSFWARLRTEMRRSPIATTAALVTIATVAQAQLRRGEGPLSEKVALACIESGAHKCVFRTESGEVEISTTEMPAYNRISSAEVVGNASPTLSEVWEAPRFTNIPAAPETETVLGTFERRGSDIYLVQRDGAWGRVSGWETEEQPPIGDELLVVASAVRGDHGGFADREILVRKWADVMLGDDGAKLKLRGKARRQGHLMLIEADDGETFEIAGVRGNIKLDFDQPSEFEVLYRGQTSRDGLRKFVAVTGVRLQE